MKFSLTYHVSCIHEPDIFLIRLQILNGKPGFDKECFAFLQRERERMFCIKKEEEEEERRIRIRIR